MKGTSGEDVMDGTKSNTTCAGIDATIKEESHVYALSKEPKGLVRSNKPKDNTP